MNKEEQQQLNDNIERYINWIGKKPEHVFINQIEVKEEKNEKRRSN